MPKRKYCGEDIKFVKMDNGKWMPCDVDAIHFNDCEEKMNLVMEDGTLYPVDPEHKYPQDSSYGYVPHFTTCRKAAT